MAPKKVAAAATPKKAATTPAHASYKDMIKEAILNLKERNGSSRQGLKKYIMANNKTNAATPAIFDAQFNKALRTGVEKGDFLQPKGASGPVKLAKKDGTAKSSTEASATKSSAKKASPTVTKAAAPKKAAIGRPKGTTTAAKEATTKKVASKKTPAKRGPKKEKPSAGEAAPASKASASKKSVKGSKAPASATPSANSSSKRKTPAAPAIIDVEPVLGKTKSGRVTKSTGPKLVATPKKAAAKKGKATPAKKAATPKKKAAEAETTT